MCWLTEMAAECTEQETACGNRLVLADYAEEQGWTFLMRELKRVPGRACVRIVTWGRRSRIGC